MVIYGEYLFLENMITGVLILRLTAAFSGIAARRGRELLGGIFCGIYAFIIFFPLGTLAATTLKLTFSGFLIAVVFGKREKKIFMKLVLLFYFLSFAMGGCSIGFLYFFRQPGVSGSGIVYMGLYGYLFLGVSAAVSYLLLSLVGGWMRSRLFEGSTAGRVTVNMLGVKKELLGLWDTGNRLREPITGRAVFLVTEESLRGLIGEEERRLLISHREPFSAAAVLEHTDLGSRVALIPYRSVGREQGVLLGIRPDYIEIDLEGEKKMRKDVVLGVYHGFFGCCGTGEAYEILMHCDVKKGGLVCHG